MGNPLQLKALYFAAVSLKYSLSTAITRHEKDYTRQSGRVRVPGTPRCSCAAQSSVFFLHGLVCGESLNITGGNDGSFVNHLPTEHLAMKGHVKINLLNLNRRAGPSGVVAIELSS